RAGTATATAWTSTSPSTRSSRSPAELTRSAAGDNSALRGPAEVPVDRAPGGRPRELPRDRSVDGAVQEPRPGLGVVQAGEPVHAVVERTVDAERPVLPARPALHVRDGDRRLVPGDPAGPREAVAEVEVLHVEPVALVEAADLVERAPPDEHERAADRVDRPALHARRAVLGERRGRAVAATDPREVCERAERRRERPPRGVIEAAVLALEPAAADPDLGVLVHQLEEVVEHARPYASVWVEREQVARTAASNREVPRGG